MGFEIRLEALAAPAHAFPSRRRRQRALPRQLLRYFLNRALSGAQITHRCRRQTKPCGTCSSDTAFGALNGQTLIPPSGVPWAFIYYISYASGSTYSGPLVAGASSYANGGTGGCAAPGTGGGCGTIVGSFSVTFGPGGTFTATFTCKL